MSDIQHLEDFLLSKGSSAKLNQFKRSLIASKNSDSPGPLKLKIDGSPAFIFGKYEGKKIVSTKSFFNKVRKYWTLDQLQSAILHEDLKKVLTKVHRCVRWENVQEGTIIQGDWLAHDHDFSTTTCANILHYSTNGFWENYPIVALHTMYLVNERGDLVESVTTKDFVDLMDANLVKIEVELDHADIIGGVEKLVDYAELVEISEETSPFVGRLLVEFSRTGKQCSKTTYPEWSEFGLKFIKDEFMNKIQSLKTEKAKQVHSARYFRVSSEFTEKAYSIWQVCQASESFKALVASRAYPISRACPYVIVGGDRLWGHEGFVAYIGSSKVKLVHRFFFSWANFNHLTYKAFEHRRD